MRTSPTGQIEEAIVLLRRQDARAWMQYLVGATPFLLTLLAFLRDMSAGYFARRCAVESLACALLFLWASGWKARFGGTLLAAMNGAALPAIKGGFWRTFYLQSILQTLKLLTFPLAAAAILPIAWTSSFFRHAAIAANLPAASARSVIATSARRASFDMRGNWIGLLLLSLASVFVFINLYILVGLLPILVRTFSGYENLFTRHAESFFTFNIFCIVLALTWLVIDPLVLSYTAVRCFYAEAQTDGRDLLARLRPAAAFAALLLVSLGFGSQLPARMLSDKQLSHALQQASKGDDYGWLRAREEARSEVGNRFFKRLGEDVNSIGRAVKSWFSSIGKWLRRLLDRANAKPDQGIPVASASRGVHWLLYLLGAVVLLVAIMVLLRSLNKTETAAIGASAGWGTRDLTADNMLASDVSEEEWLRLAGELLAKGEGRQAVRALYLSNLAYLGSQRFLQIAKAKSNAVYERELRLRPRASGAWEPFAQANRSFERAWYGFHEVTPEFVELYQQNVEAIRRYAKA